MEVKRICIYPKDVQRITGKSERYRNSRLRFSLVLRDVMPVAKQFSFLFQEVLTTHLLHFQVILKENYPLFLFNIINKYLQKGK